MKCGTIQNELLDFALEKSGRTLPPHLWTHVENCAACQEEWKRLQGWVLFMRSDEEWQPSEDFLQNLVEKAMWEKRRGELTEMATPPMGWSQDFGQFWRSLFRTSYGMAYALLLILLLPLLYGGWLEWQAVGRVEYVSGSVLAGAHRLSDGEPDLEIERDTEIRTPQEAQCILTLERGAQLMMDSMSRVVVHHARQVEVQRGKVFFDIVPGKGEFEVILPEGTVQVLGTSFEITVSEKGSEVAVARGLVAIARGGEEKRLSPGQVGVIQAEQREPQVQAAPSAEALAARLRWIQLLQEEKNQEDLRKYYPSLAVPKPTVR